MNTNVEYIRKKWDEPTMEKRLDNLKKLFGDEVENHLAYYANIVESRLDAMYLTYYTLKDKHCKVRRGLFGKPKMVDFKYKKPQWTYYESPNWFNGATSATTTNTWTTASSMDYTSLYSSVFSNIDEYTWDVVRTYR